MRILQNLIAIALLAVAPALAQATANHGTNRPDTTNQTAPRESGTNAGGVYVLDEKHVLEPGDRLSFQILEDRDPPKNLIVTDSRELDVPYIGRISVAGKTCKVLAKDLKVLLEKEYYFRATVVLGLDSVNKVRGKIFIYGQVRNQGSVDLIFDEKLTASQAILRAGGFGDFAYKKGIKVLRPSEKDPTITKTIEINMVEVLEDGKTEKDLVLEPGDKIFVPQRLMNFK